MSQESATTSAEAPPNPATGRARRATTASKAGRGPAGLRGSARLRPGGIPARRLRPGLRPAGWLPAGLRPGGLRPGRLRPAGLPGAAATTRVGTSRATSSRATTRATRAAMTSRVCAAGLRPGRLPAGRLPAGLRPQGGYDPAYGRQAAGYAPAAITLYLEDGSNRTFQLGAGSNVIGRGQDAQFLPTPASRAGTWRSAGTAASRC